ncbi:hypothetical protein Tco_1001203 [Tanacetum coccineum]
MAQLQRQYDVHQDELCPPNKCYALMDANKKIDLDNLLCPNESKIMANILQNHPLRKELTVTLDDFRIIFQLPQATNNNHERFVVAPKFSIMAPFFLNDLGFTLKLRSPSNFKTTGLVQPWQTLGKIFARCLITQAIGHDQPPLQIMQMLYWFVNNMHVDYVELLWEGLHYELEHPSTLILYPRFTKLIGTHKTTSAPRSPNPDIDEGESSVQQKSTVIRLCIPPRRSTRLTPPIPILTTDEADDIILQDIIQLSLAEQKIREELEANQNEEKVQEHLMAEEIEKPVEGTENVKENKVDRTNLRQNDNQNDLGTRLEPKRNKESPEVEKTAEVQPVNVNEEEEESTKDDYEIHSTLISSDIEKLHELTINNPSPSSSTPSSSLSTLSATKRLLSLFKPKTGRFKRYKNFFDEIQGHYGYFFGHLKTRFLARTKFNELAQHLQEIMEELLPKMVDDRVKELTKKHVPLYVAEGLLIERQQSQADVAKMIADAIQQDRENLRAEISSQINNDCTQDNPHDDAHPEGEYDAKRQKTSEHRTYVFGESSSGQVNESEPDDDELSTEKMSQELVDEMSHTVNEAKLHKVNDIVWESRKEILVSPYPRKPTPVVQSCQRDPKALALSLVNQDLLYLKKGNSGPEKIVLSLYKFPTVIFSDDDIEERTLR